MGNRSSAGGEPIISCTEARKRCSDEEWERYNRGFAKLTRLNKGKLSLRVFQTQIVPFLHQDLTTAMFDVFDHGRTGFLNKDEFLIGMALVSHGTPEEKLRLLFHMYDLDKTGKLTRSDLGPFVSMFSRTREEQKILSRFTAESFQESDCDYMEFKDFERLVATLKGKNENNHPAIFSWIFNLGNMNKTPEMPDISSLDAKFWTRRDSLTYDTNFDKREVVELQKFWEKSMLTKSTDQCDLETFVKFFSEDIPKNVVEKIFRSFDTNNQGSISTRDFIVGLSTSVRGTEEEKLKFAFRAVADIPHGGSKDPRLLLNREGLKEMLTSLWTMIDVKSNLEEDASADDLQKQSDQLRLLKLDRNISVMDNPDHIESLVQSIFKHYACERDGKISFKEFRAWTQDNPSALEFMNKLSAITSKNWSCPNSVEEERMLLEETLLHNDELKVDDIYYVISYKWFEQWAAHVSIVVNGIWCKVWGETTQSGETPDLQQKDSDGEISPPYTLPKPGPMDNSTLLTQTSFSGTELKPNLQINIDFVAVNEQAWLYLSRWYGGGPPIARKVIPNSKSEEQKEAELRVELYPLMFSVQTIASPFRDSVSFEIQISSRATQNALRQRIADKLRLNPDKMKLMRLNGQDQSVPVEVDDLQLLEDSKLQYGDIILVDLMGPDGEFFKNRSKSKGLFRSRNQGYLSRQRNYNNFGKNSRYMRGYSRRDRQQTNRRDEKVIPGRCGLYNIGNSCFMNSALQALLHCPPLQKYFSMGIHRHEVSDTSEHGTRGALPSVFGDLLEQCWGGEVRAVAPRAVKRIVCNYQPAFRGYQQHDAQEFLNYMIDALNEDLNRVREKQYTTLADSDYRDDAIVAREWLQSYLDRNCSVITDLFQGQFKSSTRWECGRVNNIFTAFTMISMSLPEPSAKLVTLIIVFDDAARSPMKYALKVEQNEHPEHMRKRLSNLSGIEPRKMLFAEFQGAAIYTIGNLRTTRIDNFAMRRNLLVFEIPNIKVQKPGSQSQAAFEVSNMFDVLDHEETWCEATIYEIWYPPHMRDKREQERGVELDPPKITNLNFKATSDGRDVRNGRILRIHYLNYSSKWDEWISEFAPRFAPYGKKSRRGRRKKFGDLEIPDDAVFYQFVNRRLVPIDNYFFRKSEASIMGFPVLMINDPKRDLRNIDLYHWAWARFAKFTNGGAEEDRPFVLKKVRKDGLTCSSCGWDRGCTGCSIPLNRNKAELRNMQSIAIDWNEKFWRQYVNEEALLENGVVDHLTVSLNDDSVNKPVDISHCLKTFSEDEKLDKVFCSDCKEFTPATKKIELWTTPKVLILHLKRLVHGRKLFNNIEFPFELDLEPYITSRSKSKEENEKISKRVDIDFLTGSAGKNTNSDEPASPPSSALEEPLLKDQMKTSESSYLSTDNKNDKNEENEPDDTEMKVLSRRLSTVIKADYLQAVDQEEKEVYKCGKPILYDLFAVVEHLGGSTGGHYICKAISKENESDDEMSSWCLFNDGRVTKIAASEVCTRTAYMLFYLRRDVRSNEDPLSFLPEIIKKRRNENPNQEQLDIIASGIRQSRPFCGGRCSCL